MKELVALVRRLLAFGAVVALSAVWPAVARAQFPGPDEWYVRLVVAAGPLLDPGNGLGRVDGGADGFDDFDLEELPPFDPPYLTIVFPHPEWGAHAGDYTVDLRERRHGAGGVWSFEVRSDVARAVTISWEVVEVAGEEVLARSRLVDEDTPATVVPSAGGSYSAVMASTVHRFLWEVDAVPIVDAGPNQVAGVGEVVSLAPASFSDEDDDDQHLA
ncbi:MAG: hypothetical protein MUE34_14265, partial [Acidimicrobiales bacterium]|nr:hypothetical protein [Acidimicrobiales bacterium]